MAKSTRLIDIWFYINERSFFTAQELADEFKVSLRTIQRDLMDLTLMGVPFYSKAGHNGGYYMQHGKMLPPITFSFEEVLSILVTYDTLDNYIDNPYQLEMTSIKEKLLNKLSNNNIQDYYQIKDYLTMWNQPHFQKSEYTRIILDSAIDKRKIEIEYMSSGVTSKRVLAPIGIYGNNGFWYFPAYDFSKEDYRLFRSDRVQKINVLDHHQMDLISLDDWLSCDYQYTNSIEIELELTEKGLSILSRNIDFKDVKKINNHYNYIGKIRNSDLNFTAMYLISAKNEVKVLKPIELINEMKNIMVELNLYMNKTYT